MSQIDPMGLEDPDGLDEMVLELVAEAAALLRESAPADPRAVDATVERIRAEATLSAVLGAMFGGLGRVGRAMPHLLGIEDPPPEPDRPDDPGPNGQEHP